MHLYILRHAESYSNVQGKIMSTTDLPLTERGIRQAEATKTYLRKLAASETFHHVFSSPLIRAQQTAAVVCENENSIYICKNLREMDLGKLEGLTWAERNNSYPQINVENLLTNAIIPEGESFDDIRCRCNSFINEHLIQKTKDEKILIVSHGITIRVLINSLLGKPDHCVNYINWADNAAVSEIECSPDGSALIRLNDRTHLVDSCLGTPNYDTWGMFASIDYITA